MMNTAIFPITTFCLNPVEFDRIKIRILAWTEEQEVRK